MTDKTVMQTPTAPISQQSHPDDEWTIDALHGHIECLHGEGDHFSKASADAIGWCLGRIEALTAENARLTSENARLQVEMESAYGDLTNSLMTGFSHGRPTAKELEERIQRAKSALEGAVFGGAGNWYTRHRSQVEAAHAAKRNAWPRYCHSPSSCTRHQACMYMNCRHEGQDIRPAIAAHEEAKDDADEAEGLRPLTDDEIEAGSYLLTRAKTGGIDLDLLGDLCREEPDEATKQAVAEMMDGLNGGKEGRQ